MNKHFLSLVLALSMGASSLVAVESSVQNKGLSKADSALLFGANAQNVDVALLSDKEMKETKGEGVLLATFLGSAANAAGAAAGAAAVWWVGHKLKWW